MKETLEGSSITAECCPAQHAFWRAVKQISNSSNFPYQLLLSILTLVPLRSNSWKVLILTYYVYCLHHLAKLQPCAIRPVLSPPPKQGVIYSGWDSEKQL